MYLQDLSVFSWWMWITFHSNNSLSFTCGTFPSPGFPYTCGVYCILLKSNMVFTLQIAVCTALDFVTDHTCSALHIIQWFSEILVFSVDSHWSLLCHVTTAETSNLENVRRNLSQLPLTLTREVTEITDSLKQHKMCKE